METVIPPRWAAESVVKSFGGRMVLRNAGCWAYPGAVSALLGRNGCGKTTLVRIGVGQLRGDEGVVLLEDQRYARPRLATLARKGLFYLRQERMLTPSLTVGEHLEVLAAAFPEARVDEAVTTARIRDFLPRLAHTLSGGEQRRVELAIALARCPTCLVADEPFLGIMPKDAQLFVEVFRRMAETGCALLLTGHELEDLFQVADHIIWMTGGTTHFLGSPAEALGHEQFLRGYVGPGRAERLRANLG